MSNYNTQLQSNNTDLQQILQTLQNKASTGTVLQDKTVSPSIETQVVTADTGYDGLRQVTVNRMKLQLKTASVTWMGSQIRADSGYDGLGEVIIDPEINLKPENIISGVSIFGVEGSATGSAQTVTGTIIISQNTMIEGIYIGRYTDAAQSVCSETFFSNATITVLKNTIIEVGEFANVSGEVTYCGQNQERYDKYYLITGDFEVR